MNIYGPSDSNSAHRPGNSLPTSVYGVPPHQRKEKRKERRGTAAAVRDIEPLILFADPNDGARRRLAGSTNTNTKRIQNSGESARTTRGRDTGKRAKTLSFAKQSRKGPGDAISPPKKKPPVTRSVHRGHIKT